MGEYAIELIFEFGKVLLDNRKSAISYCRLFIRLTCKKQGGNPNERFSTEKKQ